MIGKAFMVVGAVMMLIGVSLAVVFVYLDSIGWIIR